MRVVRACGLDAIAEASIIHVRATLRGWLLKRDIGARVKHHHIGDLKVIT